VLGVITDVDSSGALREITASTPGPFEGRLAQQGVTAVPESQDQLRSFSTPGRPGCGLPRRISTRFQLRRPKIDRPACDPQCNSMPLDRIERGSHPPVAFLLPRTSA